MPKFAVDITVEIEAEDTNQAWEKANWLVADYNGVVSVSEPEEVEE